MKVLLYEDGFVDFEAPIFMSESQKEKFNKFMKEMFPDIKFGNVLEKIKTMGERETSVKKWTAEEISSLFGGLSNEELSIKMKRSLMSVRMARGSKIAEISAWAKKKGKKIPMDIKSIEEFLKGE